MTILRPYQRAAVNSIYSYFEKNDGNPVVAMPTGSGKSEVFAEFIRGVFEVFPGQRMMMLTHVKELIDSGHKRLLRAWGTAPAGIYSAGLRRRDTVFPITFAGIASVNRRANEFGHIDLIIIDECHLVGAKSNTMYRSFINDLLKINPLLKVIGFSATPYRLGLGVITDGGLFTDFCYDNTRREDFNELIDAGWLMPLIPRRTQTEFDLDGVSIRGGEYVPDQLQNAVDKPTITSAAVEELIEHGLRERRRKWLMFGAGIEHVEHITEQLVKRGIKAASVHSNLSDDDRDNLIAAFRRGEITALVNNNMLTTGHDFPDLDLIGMLRPTTSPGLWVQMLGRGTRPSPETGKTNCLVLDFAGNTARLGPINDPVMPKKRGGLGVAPVRLCPACSAYNHASQLTCSACGYEFPPPQRAAGLSREADTRELIARPNMIATKYGAVEAPTIAEFAVTRVTYKRHVSSKGKPPSIRVDYTCGLRRFTEWVCVEHAGYAHMRAQKWWEAHSSWPMPETTEQFMEASSFLPVPVKITVWVNREYPEVMSYVFSNPAQPASEGEARNDEATHP